MNKQKVPKLRFPGFTGEWQKKRLGDVATFSKGKNISKADISETGTECIRYGELYTHYRETIDKVISRTNIDKKDLVLSDKNDLIIPASGETAIDISTACCILKQGIAIGGDINIIKSKQNGIFMAYYLSNGKKLDIANLAQGISVIHLYSKQLATLELYLPTLPEQKRIAEFLSDIDTKIEKLTRKKEFTEQYKKGAMQKIFSQKIRFKDDKGRNYPDWEEKRLGDVFDHRSERGDESFELLSVTMNDGVKKRTDIESKDNSNPDKSNYKIVCKNDIVYNSMRMWQGASGVSPYKGIVSPAYTVLSPRVNADSVFFGYFFKTEPVIQVFQNNSQGLTSDTWNLKYPQLSKIKFKIPCVSEQKKIAEFLTDFDKKIEHIDRELARLKEYKKGLLQGMFV